MLSKVEHIERLRVLPFSQRLRYTLTLSVAVVAAFVGCVALAILSMWALSFLLDGSPPAVESLVTVSLPLVMAFMAAIGFTGNPYTVGQTTRQAARKAARFGVAHGFIAGLVFGLLWAGIPRLVTAVSFQRWDVLLRSEVLIFGLVLALYRAVTSIIETVVLNAVTGNRSQTAR